MLVIGSQVGQLIGDILIDPRGNTSIVCINVLSCKSAFSSSSFSGM